MMESVRAVVYLSVCLSVLTALCQGQRSTDNQLPSAPDESVLGFTTRELVSHLSSYRISVSKVDEESSSSESQNINTISS